MSALLSFTAEPAHEQPLREESPLARLEASSDFVSIRGVRLPLAELVDRSFFEPGQPERLLQQLKAGAPCPHLVMDGLFNPALLELVAEEFDALPGTGWVDVKNRYESIRRSVSGITMGPASQLYFDTLHSGWFTEWLSSVSGVPYLLPDPKLCGGGLHESRTGATFAVHRDFNRHRSLGLMNQMVFITYLNKGWDPEWGSALELWDKKAGRCVTTVQPEFGRTILLPHGPTSFHGHTKPLKTPDDRPRRSVAAYFYTSPFAGQQHGDALTVFMQPQGIDKAKSFVRLVTPPVVWSLARKFIRH